MHWKQSCSLNTYIPQKSTPSRAAQLAVTAPDLATDAFPPLWIEELVLLLSFLVPDATLITLNPRAPGWARAGWDWVRSSQAQCSTVWVWWISGLEISTHTNQYIIPIHLYIHTSVHTYMYIQTEITISQLQLHMHIHLYRDIHIHMPLNIHIHICIHLHVHIHIHINTCIPAYVHTYVRTHTYAIYLFVTCRCTCVYTHGETGGRERERATEKMYCFSRWWLYVVTVGIGKFVFT